MRARVRRPRIRDLPSKRIYVFEPTACPKELRGLIGLNKGESHHALKNALRIGRQGEIRDRSTEGQHYRMAGLNLLACISHHPTVEAHDMTAMTSLRLLAVLNVLSSTPARAKRLAPRPDGPLTHFASPRGEKCRLKDFALAVRERARAEEASSRCGLLRMLIERRRFVAAKDHHAHVQRFTRHTSAPAVQAA